MEGDAPRIMFVDDDPLVLGGFRNTLRRFRHWDQTYATSGESALELLAARPVDVLVSDIRMPQMDGPALLATVQREHPQTVRVILSGQAEHTTILRTVAIAHRFLSKPSPADVLRAAVAESLELRAVPLEVRRSLGGMVHLPTTVGALETLRRQLAGPVSSAELVLTFQRDPALASRLLQLVSSSFFGQGQPTTSIYAAIRYLGVDLLAELAGRTDVFSTHERGEAVDRASDEVRRRSTRAARLAGRLVADEREAELAFTATLLADVGAVAMCSTGHGLAPDDADGVSAALLHTWGLAPTLGALVAHRRRPRPVPGVPDAVVAAVHVARALEADDAEAIDREFLRGVGLVDALPAWRAIADDERRVDADAP